MQLFSTQMPSSLIGESDEAVRFVAVLDDLQKYKQQLLLNFSVSKDPILFKDITLIKKLLAELGNIPTSDYMTLGVYECLLFNAGKIWAYKGTRTGITQFYKCVSLGDVSIDTTNLNKPPTYIIPSDLGNGYLQLASADDATNVADYARYPDGLIYLFSDYVPSISSLTIIFHTPFYLNPLFRDYVLYTIPIMFPFIKGNTYINLIINDL